MAIEKVLIKIQKQITELVNNLEDFVQPSVQPSSQECEQLKLQLAHLQDLLAVYTHLKHDKELSPSFNIHSKVSNTAAEMVLSDNQEKTQVLHTNQTKEEEKKLDKTDSNIENEAELKPIQTNNSKGNRLVFGINDKFRIINELFKQNNNEYNIAIEQFNAISNLNDAETFLVSLAELYGWSERSETVKFFYNSVRGRFK